MKRHYELEYNSMVTGWTRLYGKYSTLKHVRKEIHESRFPERYRIIQITEKVIHPKKKSRK